MSARALAWRRIGLYLALVAVLSGLFDALILHAGTLGAGYSLYVTGIMWMPAAAAVLTCRLTGLPLGALGWRWPSWREVAVAWLLPLAYAAVTYSIVWLGGWGGVPNPTFVAELGQKLGLPGWPAPALIALYVALIGTIGVLRGISTGLGEEIGWRGFLVPQLAQVTGFGGVVAISGAAWLLYHVPILVGADYNAGTPWWYGLSCFAVMVFGMGAYMAAVRLRTGSLWPAAIIHGSHNAFVQRVFTPLTSDTGPTEWIIDEFGVALAFAIGAIGAWTMLRGGATAARRREPA